MEIIKKKINLEKFKSRIPTLLQTIETNEEKNSWGKMPKRFIVLNSNMRYKEIIDLYYSLFKVIQETVYYKLDGSGGKWIEIKQCDWRDMYYYGINEKTNLKYFTYLPDTLNRIDNEIIGITTDEGSYIMNEIASSFKNGESHQGIKVFNELNKVLGIEIVPTIYEGLFVPKMIYVSLIEEYINKLETFNNDTCCNRKLYEEYGGNKFKEYLKNIRSNATSYGYINLENPPTIPTIEIPILLTSDVIDLGQYRTNDVDVVFDSYEEENDTDLQTLDISDDTKMPFIETSGESKLLTLRKRRKTFTDDNIELPLILTKYTENDTNSNKTILELKKSNGELVKYEKEDIFQVGFIKNIEEYDGIYYGDTILSITETFSVKETDELQYNNFKNALTQSNNSKYIIEGTTAWNNEISNKIFGFTEISEFNYNYVYSEYTYPNKSKAEENCLKLYNEQIDNIINKLKNAAKNQTMYVCFKQEYKFKYELYYEENKKRIKFTEEKKGNIYVISCDNRVTFTYVIGGKLSKLSGNKGFKLDETYPSGSGWNGSGIWYRETFPKKILCSIEDVKLDGEIFEILFYDEIDIPKNKHILCENVKYKTETYKATNDVIFKDEKMLGINSLKENYDVIIDRGSSAAFEKHLQLSEIKTWKDLENYRNGMFLNK